MIYPVILSGGSGTRLWPLSREQYPKQLLALTGERTLLQETVLRLDGAEQVANPLFVCNEEHRFLVAEQLREMNIKPQAIILEPAGRNTAPAVALGALAAMEQDKDMSVIRLPGRRYSLQAEFPAEIFPDFLNISKRLPSSFPSA